MKPFNKISSIFEFDEIIQNKQLNENYLINLWIWYYQK
jgi:hypothetical protein